MREVGRIEMHSGQDDFEVLTETDGCDDDGIKDWRSRTHSVQCPPALRVPRTSSLVCFLFICLWMNSRLGAVLTFRSGSRGVSCVGATGGLLSPSSDVFSEPQ